MTKTTSGAEAVRAVMTELLRAHIADVWPVEVAKHVTMADGRAFNPARGSRSVTPLIYARDHDGEGMLREMRKILDRVCCMDR